VICGLTVAWGRATCQPIQRVITHTPLHPRLVCGKLQPISTAPSVQCSGTHPVPLFPTRLPPFLTRVLKLVKRALRFGTASAFASLAIFMLENTLANISEPVAEALTGNDTDPASAVSLKAVLLKEDDLRETSIEAGVQPADSTTMSK